MIEKAVIYNTIDRTGIAPEAVFNKKQLPIGVYERVDITREQMKELFYLWDLDHVSGANDTNKFGNKLLDLLHSKMLEGVENDKVVKTTFKEEVQETTIPKKYYLDAGIEDPIDHKPLIYGHIK